ncbi:NUDIX domain-containing protein [Myxococcota bacterium]|nr:NUDIX domain-containing protein [Myxococcota bacterium]
MAPLVIAPHHRVSLVDGRVVVDADDERSLLRPALERHLARSLEDGTSAVSLDGRVRARFGDTPWAAPLTAFEARYLADNDVPLASRDVSTTFTPRTDLHTHFAACLSGAELVALGAEHGLVLSPAQLEELGVHAARPVAVASLDARARGRIAAALDLPIDQQSFFLEMERRYDRRRPFVRAPELFLPNLVAIARRFAASGVRYAELSLGDCLEPARLAVLHEHLDAIEAETGVRLRFLVALRRDDDPEWDFDVLARLGDCLASRAIAGIDVMGHETCSTRAFLPVLARAAALAKERPGLVIRVHAGENPAYPENVREAFLALRDHPDVELRIGHGLYGVDDALERELARHADHVIVEFNLSSNLALNNIQGTREVPLVRYLDAGVACVLGTDGAGLYSTSAADEVRAAIACGLAPAHLARLEVIEAELLARKAEREGVMAPLRDVPVPPARPLVFYGDAVRAAREAERAARGVKLRARVDAIGATLIERTRPNLHGRRALWISGAWKNAIFEWTPAHVAQVRALFDALMPALRDRGTIVVTGGTSFGVEGLAHEAAARHGVDVLGVIVDDLDPAGLDPRVRSFWLVASSLWKKTEPVVRWMRDVDGLALFVGGGPIVADEHQAVVNLGVRHAVVPDLPGIAAEAARQRRATRFVDDAAAIVAALGDLTPRGKLRHVGPNDAVDLVVLRRAPGADAREVLVIVRHDQSGVAAGAWSLPGGFVMPGEPARAAALRVLARETGVEAEEAALHELCTVEGPGRDPRDTPERWVRSTVFTVELEHDAPITAAAGAARASFVRVEDRPALAFDHDALVERASVTPQRRGSAPT